MGPHHRGRRKIVVLASVVAYKLLQSIGGRILYIPISTIDVSFPRRYSGPKEKTRGLVPTNCLVSSFEGRAACS